MVEICEFIASKSKLHNDRHEEFISILKNPKTGLFVNERLLNMTPVIAPVLHNQLAEDLKWVRDNKEIDSSRFQFEYLVVLTKLYREAK